jgi:hypothetical protein
MSKSQFKPMDIRDFRDPGMKKQAQMAGDTYRRTFSFAL